MPRSDRVGQIAAVISQQLTMSGVRGMRDGLAHLPHRRDLLRTLEDDRAALSRCCFALIAISPSAVSVLPSVAPRWPPPTDRAAPPIAGGSSTAIRPAPGTGRVSTNRGAAARRVASRRTPPAPGSAGAARHPTG